VRTVVAILLAVSSCFAARPVIFDTDMGNDIDDALALAMLHALTDRGECQLIGVTLTNGHRAAAPYIQMVNSFYGRGDLPVGLAMRTLMGGAQGDYLSAVLQTAPAQFRGSGKILPAVTLLRQLLSAATEKVVIVQTGFSTSLAALLDSPGGPELARNKVERVVAMAGDFSGGGPEYNVRIDIPSAKTVFESWPTPVIFSGFEIGRDLLYPAAAIAHDFAYAKWHPIAESYRAYHKMPYDRPTWDLTAVLEAVRPERYFMRSVPGTVRVEPDGITRFTPGAGDRCFLRLDRARSAEILQVLQLLASEPPGRRP